MKEHTFPLPSRGLFEGSLASMTIREMKVREEKGLFSAKKPFIKMMNLIKELMIRGEDAKGNIVESLDISSWPLVDMTHALFQVRQISVGRIYEFRAQCPICDTAVPFGVDLIDGLETQYAPDDVSYTYDVDLSMGLVTCKHLLVKDQITLDRLIRQRGAKLGINHDQGYSLRLAAQLAGFNGEEFSSIVTAENWMEDRTSREREEISSATEEKAFGDDLSIDIDCPNCKSLELGVMPITRDFLFRRSNRRR